MWQLIAALIEEATGMTGDQAVDKIRIERGAGYLRAFKEAYPFQYAFVQAFITKSPQECVSALAAFNPNAARLPFAQQFIAAVQARILRR